MKTIKELLLADIESSVGRRIKTPKDFDTLRERIFGRLGILVSATTLKRVWGYLPGDVETRESTLDILARFIGYGDWAYYRLHRMENRDPESNPVMSRSLDVSGCLKPGDTVTLTWQPDRICRVRYLGDMEFEVEWSRHTRLQAGDRFRCAHIIEGEPLYLDHLIQTSAPKAPTAYVCGRQSGVRFEKNET